MKKFKSYLKKYNSFIEKKERLEKSLIMIEDDSIINVVKKEISSINDKISEFENLELYTQSDFDNFKAWN